MYQNNRSSVSHFLHIKMPGNNLNISGNWSEIYAIILNTLTDWILTFCFIARECRWHVATFWQTLTINIQNCTDGLTLQLHFASRSGHWYQGWKLRHCQHTECLLYGGKGHHFPAIDKWRGFLPTNATKRLFWRDIYYVDYVYICYRVWIRFMTRQNGDKLFRQRRLRAEFVSRLRLEEEKWGKEKRVPRARQHLLTQLIISQSSVFFPQMRNQKAWPECESYF